MAPARARQSVLGSGLSLLTPQGGQQVEAYLTQWPTRVLRHSAHSRPPHRPPPARQDPNGPRGPSLVTSHTEAGRSPPEGAWPDEAPSPAPREVSAGKNGSPPASARPHAPFSPSPQLRAQGRVPEAKGPCWWVTPGELPGERRIPRSGSARSPRVSEGRSGARGPELAEPPLRAAAGAPQPGHWGSRLTPLWFSPGRPLCGPAPASGGHQGPPSRPAPARGLPIPPRPWPPRVEAGTGNRPGLSRPIAERPCSNSLRVTIASNLIKHFSC